MKNYRSVIISFLLGICVFILLFGVSVIDVTSIGRLIGSGSDLTQHYMGWKAFRYSAWRFPPGLCDNLAWPLHTSIVYTDSIPLLAVPFKLVRGILPDNFQYFGIYQLLNFGLTGAVSAWLLRRYIKNDMQVILGSLFFITAPVFMDRVFLHVALSSHWLILLCFGTVVYYDEVFVRFRHALILAVVTGVLGASLHPYLTAICGTVWLGWCILNTVKERKLLQTVVVMSAYAVSAAAVLYMLGAFNRVFAASRGGIGSYSMNLAGLVNGQGRWSLLPGIPLPEGCDEVEAMSYVGLGAAVLLVIAVLRYFAACIKLAKYQLQKNSGSIMAPAVIIPCLVCFAAALSPTISFASNILVKLELPEFIIKLWSIFRCTGRFAWPIVYVLMLAGIVGAVRYLRLKAGTLILAAALAVQLADISPGMLDKHNELAQSAARAADAGLDERLADDILKPPVKHLYFASVGFKTGDYYKVTDYATDHGLTVNRFYFARKLDEEALAERLSDALWEKAETDAFIFLEKDIESAAEDGFEPYPIGGGLYAAVPGMIP